MPPCFFASVHRQTLPRRRARWYAPGRQALYPPRGVRDGTPDTVKEPNAEHQGAFALANGNTRTTRPKTQRTPDALTDRQTDRKPDGPTIQPFDGTLYNMIHILTRLVIAAETEAQTKPVCCTPAASGMRLGGDPRSQK